MFLHLAAHAGFHGARRLLWLYDIKRFAERHGETLDWAVVTRCATTWGLSLAVRRAVEQTQALWGPLFQSGMVDELAAHPTGWRDRLTLTQAPRDARSPVAHVVVDVLCTPGVRFRWGYLIAQLIPGRKHLAEVYPYRHPGWPLGAHLWRVLRVVGRAWLGFCRAARHAKQRKNSVSSLNSLFLQQQ